LLKAFLASFVQPNMPTQVVPISGSMSKRVVIIGGGLSAKHAAEVLKKKSDSDITVIQANRFVEWPLASTVFVVDSTQYDKAHAPNCDSYQVPGVNYKYGVAESVDAVGKQVKLKDDSEPVSYDALIVATGFDIPLLYPRLGVSLQDRKVEIQKASDAIKKATNVVVAGGGIVGLELAGDIRAACPSLDKKVVLLCRGGVIKDYPEKMRTKVENRLKAMNIEVVSCNGDAPKEYSLSPGVEHRQQSFVLRCVPSRLLVGAEYPISRRQQCWAGERQGWRHCQRVFAEQGIP